jgi:hypothetical protein
MRAASSPHYLPGRSRWLLALIVFASIVIVAVLLALVAGLTGAIGASTPVEMDLLGPFRWLDLADLA